MNDNRLIDLHVHSNASDGTLAPAELVKLAYESGLSAMALTDHDSVLGVEEALNTELPIEVIPGIELSAGYKDGDIHILGLYVNHKDKMLLDISENVIKERDQRNMKMISNLAADGIDITEESLREVSGGKGVITRGHFAKFLIARGYVSSAKEAFAKYLSPGTPYFVNRQYLSPEDCIEIILKCGGYPVLAHPVLYNLPEDELNTLIRRLKNAGLIGIETIYSTYSPEEEQYVRSLAQKYDLIITGGSDYHGANKPDINIGTGRGNLKVPYLILDNLKKSKIVSAQIQ